MKTEDELWDLSEEELEAAFKEAVAQGNSPETDLESEDEVVTSDEEDSFDEADNSAVEEEEDEVLDGPDQPEVTLEESGHNTSDESNTDEVEEDNTDEADEDDPDGDAESEKEESSETTEKSEEEEQPTQSYSFRANGKDYEFSSDEIVDQFPKIFGKAMDYTKKMQTIKPWRKTIDAIEGAKLSHDDVSLMIDVLKGDKNAITEVLKRTGTDTLELDTDAESNYVTKNYGRDDSALAISDIVEEIGQDAEYATTKNILEKQWDDKSWDAVSENPEMIRLLHTDVKSGLYGKLQPTIEKLKVYGGNSKSDLDYYKEAAQQHFSKIAKQKSVSDQSSKRNSEQLAQQNASEEKANRMLKAKEDSDKRNATKTASVKRKAAAPTKKASSASSAIDYLDDSDESFDEWYKALQDSV